jgi:hypothetical protein
LRRTKRSLRRKGIVALPPFAYAQNANFKLNYIKIGKDYYG